MKIPKKSISFFAILVYCACISSSNAQAIKTKELNKNYNSVLFPNTSDIVGEIFAIDNEGKMKRITNLEITSKPNDIAIGDYTKTRNFTWSMILKFLGISGSKLSGDATLQGTNDLVDKISYKETKQYTMDVLNANGLIQQKRAELQAFANSNDLKKMKFFLIIEHISAKKIDYGLTHSATTKDSISVKLGEIGTASPSVTYSGSRDYQIHYDLPQELSVLYVILPLKPPAAQLSGDNFMLEVGSNNKTVLDLKGIHE